MLTIIFLFTLRKTVHYSVNLFANRNMNLTMCVPPSPCGVLSQRLNLLSKFFDCRVAVGPCQSSFLPELNRV